MMTMTTSPPISGGVKPNKSGTAASAVTGHAVSRSNELLSCARTALKIAKASHETTAVDSTNTNNTTTTTNTNTTTTAGMNPLLYYPTIESLQLCNLSPELLQQRVLEHSALYQSAEEGLSLLRSMEFELTKLQSLVRRRGHTNDPTAEIAALIQQLEQDTQELMEFCKTLQHKATALNRRSKQGERHWSLVVTWFQQILSNQSIQLKQILKLRSEVLAEQAQRRKQMTVLQQQQHQHQQSSSASSHQSQGSSSVTNNTTPATKRSRKPIMSSSASATPLFDSPLFTATNQRQPSRIQVQTATQTSTNGHGISDAITNGTANTTSQSFAAGPPTNGTTATSTITTKPSATTHTHEPAMRTTTTASSYYGTNSGGYNGHATATAGGYGGTNSGYGGMGAGYGGYNQGFGMRQRKSSQQQQQQQQQYTNEQQQQQQDESSFVQQQIQEREQRRQTAQRVAEAREAERNLGEISTLFVKMSTLIGQQGETLQKIEDDVECALVEVTAGQEEITKLHGIKKGNRALIIKTFAILIFLIIFMRFYKR